MEDFVSFEIAKKLKEKGYNSECLAYYHTDGELILNRDQYRGGDYKSLLKSYNSLPKNPIGCEQIDAPTISQVLKWLREEKNIHITTGYNNVSKWRYIIIHMKENFVKKPNIWEKGFEAYEQAAFAGIEYVIDDLI